MELEYNQLIYTQEVLNRILHGTLFNASVGENGEITLFNSFVEALATAPQEIVDARTLMYAYLDNDLVLKIWVYRGGAEGDYSNTSNWYLLHSVAVPSKVSDLENDLEFQTKEELDSSLESLKNTIDEELNQAIGNIPVEKGSGTNSMQQKGTGAVASGYAAHAEGASTTASGTGSHAEGVSATASGYSSHAEGASTIASGTGSHAEGECTKTTNRGEHAEGRFNKSNTDTRHSVGIGTSDNNRKNAFEIMQNGDIYVIGLGGYDGTNAGATGVQTLQQLLGGDNNL